jgi:hypothetical protein
MDWVALPFARFAELVQLSCLIPYHGAACAFGIDIITGVTHCLTLAWGLVGVSIHAEECVQEEQHGKNHDVTQC